MSDTQATAATATINTQPPAPPQVSAPPAAQPSKSYLLRDQLRQRGMEVRDDVDDEVIAPRMLEAIVLAEEAHNANRQLLEENNRYKQHLDEFLNDRDDYTEWKKQKSQPSAQPQQKAKRPRPKFDELWSEHVELDPATGRYKARNQYSNPVVVEEANRYKRSKEKELDELITDPWRFVSEFGGQEALESLRKEVADLVEQKIGSLKGEWEQSWTRTREQDELERYVEKHSDVLFQGVNGRGEPVFTESGDVFNRAVAELMQMGVTDRRKIVAAAEQRMLEYQALVNKFTKQGATPAQAADAATAVQNTQAAAAPETPAAPAAPTTTPADRRKARQDTLVNRVNQFTPPPGSRDAGVASAAAAGRPQNSGLSFKQLFEQNAAAAGLQ